MFYKVINRDGGVAIVTMSENGIATITPEIAEINDLRRSGTVSDRALYEFVSFQNEMSEERLRRAND